MNLQQDNVIICFATFYLYVNGNLLYSSLVAQWVKNPPGSAGKNRPAMQETWVGSLGWEDPLEKEQLPASVYWPVEVHGLYRPWGCKQLGMTEGLSLSLYS